MNPGSQEARSCGCTCPTMDNHYGMGRIGRDGDRQFVTNQGCPVHDPVDVEDQELADRLAMNA